MTRTIELVIFGATRFRFKMSYLQNVATRPRGTHVDATLVVCRQMLFPFRRADHCNFGFGKRYAVEEQDKGVAFTDGWYQFQVEFGASLRSIGLSVIDGAGPAAFLSVVPRWYAIFNQAKIALSFDFNL